MSLYYAWEYLGTDFLNTNYSELSSLCFSSLLWPTIIQIIFVFIFCSEKFGGQIKPPADHLQAVGNSGQCHLTWCTESRVSQTQSWGLHGCTLVFPPSTTQLIQIIKAWLWVHYLNQLCSARGQMCTQGGLRMEFGKPWHRGCPIGNCTSDVDYLYDNPPATWPNRRFCCWHRLNMAKRKWFITDT